MANAVSGRASSGPTTGTFGAVGVDLRERDLARALARALPVAVRAKERWWTQRLGRLGRVRFQVVLSESGAIRNTRWLEPRGNEANEALVQRVVQLLRAGRFALPKSQTEAEQTEAFELVLRLEAVIPSDDPLAESGSIVEMGYEAPSQGRPGRAFLREAGGRMLVGQLTRLEFPGVDVSR
ncbi:hypothetical protein ACFL5O_09560 [Myxococcota bacterium]